MKNIKGEMRRLWKARTGGEKMALIALLVEYLGGSGKDTAAWFKLACCYDSLGLEKKAEPCYAEVYKAWRALPEKERPGFFVGFGSTLRNNGNIARSAAILAEGVRRFPAYPALKVFLALTLYSKKDFKGSALALFGACPEMPSGAYSGYEPAINYYVKHL